MMAKAFGLDENSLYGGYGIDGNLFTYTTGRVFLNNSYDQMMSILGNNWNNLRKGDTVSVKVQYVPNGRFIYEKDVIVD
jgi:archaeal type IV pilus assembly protein PilA